MLSITKDTWTSNVLHRHLSHGVKYISQRLADELQTFTAAESAYLFASPVSTSLSFGFNPIRRPARAKMESNRKKLALISLSAFSHGRHVGEGPDKAVYMPHAKVHVVSCL